MGIWDSILKYGGKAAKATGRSMGHAALHPSQTLRGTGQAVKTAAIGGAVGYVGWEKLTTDKSVVHIVSDAVIGKSATDTLADAADGVRELTSKAGEAVGSVSGTVAGIDSNWVEYRIFYGKSPMAEFPICSVTFSVISDRVTCRD